MSDSALQPHIDALIACGPLRVWSVVITIMGDLCRAPGDRISGRALDLLTTRMGITNQALRVALHRLKRDGWIETKREGRLSTYALTPLGFERSEAVRPLIYAAGPTLPEPVYLILHAPTATTQDLAEDIPEDAVILSPRAALATGSPEGFPPSSLVTRVSEETLPDWVAEGIADATLRAEYVALSRHVFPPENGDPMERTVIRLLAFHHYRRLRLRHGPIPDLLLGPDWEGAHARNAVTKLLKACPRPNLATLQEAANAL